ncbi:helix-turn-helix transcriptional regulator [Actinomycetospora termitidis]|uniref:LuxR C-terminal-related transcriptional regulator n=1 Tax=Actinomycetospora termitidis TaxID=3053470 RepID=A0ABT7MH09_9PSEU|nr:LuxR family transcriptional regulator [Actinomycetospora sp. Odt1-22]MDL5159970.1 LuxR C-terminal-related transcriptional regulator [Actinomycetospora sp. Odt1-22]
MQTHPFVGRDRELEDVAGALEHGGVVLVGPAGVGKTRVAREALARARAAERTTLWVAASKAAASIPFGAVAHLVPDVDTSDRLRVLRAAEQWLAGAATDRPVVLGVDDAHDLDDGSAALIGRAVASGVAVVVATLRTGEPEPGPVTALWKDGPATRVDLGPLGRSETALLVESLLGGAVDPVASEQLWQLSRGNALYVDELVRGGLVSGALTWRTGVWCWAGRVSVAPALSSLVDARLDAQPPAVRDAIDVVALGEPLRASLLERAGVALSALEEAERAGVLRTAPVADDVEVRLAHPMFGEVARTRTTSLRRRALCRRLADAHPVDEDPVRVATWYLDGGVPDAGVLARGAARALAALDLELAQRLAAGADQAGGGPDARRLLATVMVLRGHAEDAEDLLADLDVPELPDPVRAEVVAFRAWNLTFGLSRAQDAERVLDRAARSVTTGHDLLDVQRAIAHGYGGRVGPALRLARSVLDRPDAHPAARLRALTITCQIAGISGAGERARHAGEQALELDEHLHHGDWSMATEEIRAGIVSVRLYGGHLDTAEEIVEASMRRVAATGWRPGTAMWTSWRAEVALQRGHVRTALGHVREATALAARDRQPFETWASRLRALQRARLAALLGEVTEAEEALDEARRWDDGGSGMLDVWGDSSAAWVALARGEPTAAIALARDGAARARRDDQRRWEILTLHQVVRLGAPGTVVDRLAELAPCAEGPSTRLYARHARAATDGDGAELDAVADGFVTLGCLLLAAEAAAHAAAAHREAGRTSSATAAARRSRDLAARCEGARTPALSALTEPPGLTRREHEIAGLAASGLTNRVIADRLVISVRTVDNTLHQVYAKLGVPGRADLAELFDDAGAGGSPRGVGRESAASS